MHGIFYNPKHDEIVVPVALGGAVLTLPGGATGGETPLRIVQGSKTGLVGNQSGGQGFCTGLL